MRPQQAMRASVAVSPPDEKPAAAVKPAPTRIEAKPIAPVQRADEVTIVKPAVSAAKPADMPAQPVPAAKPAAATSKAGADAKIFVAPRAPDDPGLEEPEPDEAEKFAKRVYRAVT